MHSEADIYSVAPTAVLAGAPAVLVERRVNSLRLLSVDRSEPKWKRFLFLLVALVVTAGYAFFLSSYWTAAPGRPGIDENAYLLGARNLAWHGTTGFKPSDDFGYVGAMFVRTSAETFAPPIALPGFLRGWLSAHTKEGWYYPKYPAGFPLLDAIAIRLGGNSAAFAVNPICATAAVLGIFFLGRAVAGSFAGVLSMIALGCSDTMLELAELPNSHAPAVCFVVWGMVCLIWWWQRGHWWTGAAAGFLLGFAVTIRYTEALLLFPFFPLDQIFLSAKFNSALHPYLWMAVKAVRFLPVGPLGLAVLLSLRWRVVRSYLRGAIPILFWLLPVGSLVAFNWFSMGHFTGYDTTNESTGFSVQEFLGKWDFTLHELYLFGLFLLMPLGVAGLIILFRSRWRMALLLTAWLVPGALLYTAYYWGLQVPGVGFLRFFLTLFPPLIVAGLWLLGSATTGALRDERRGSVAGPLAAALLTFGTAAVGLITALPMLERQHRGTMNLHTSDEHIISMLKAHGSKNGTPIIFADEGMFPQLLQYMQFMVDGDWYTYDAFKVRAAGGLGLLGAMQLNNRDDRAPVLLQAERLKYMADVMKGKTEADLVKLQHQLIDRASASGRAVFAVLNLPEEFDFRQRFMTGAYRMVEIDHWKEPCNVRFPSNDPLESGTAIEREKSPLMPDVQSGEPFIRWQPEALKMFRIEKFAGSKK